MRRVFIACALLFASGATGPRARADAGTEFNPYHLPDTIVVTANRFATPVRETGSAVTVITRAQIERAQAPLVLDLLRTSPGLDVVQSGGAGQQTSVFLRGAKSHHALVIIDGIEMNDPSSPNVAFNWANLTADNIERIEILRGPQSVLYGSDAIGGVLQIFTRRGQGRIGGTVSAETGAFGSHRESVGLTGGGERIDYAFAATNNKRRGFSVAAAEGAEADGYENVAYSGSFSVRPASGLQMAFTGRYTASEADLDKSFGVLDDPDYRLETVERLFSSRVSYVEPAGVWSQQLGVYVTNYDRATNDVFDVAHPLDAEQTAYGGQRLKIDWQHGLRLRSWSHLTFGFESERDEFEQSLFFKSTWGDYGGRIDPVRADVSGLYALGELRFGKWVVATVGGRRDHHDRFGEALTYRVTGSISLGRTGARLRAALGSGFKAPSLFQLYDPTYGNPDLDAERSTGWEAGAEYSVREGRFACGLAFFDNDYTDLIDFDAGLGMSVNVNAAESSGWELFAALTGKLQSVRLDYTYTEAVDKADRSPLLRCPRHKASLSATRSFFERVKLTATVLHVGRRDDMDFNLGRRVRLADYTVVNIAGEGQITPRLVMYGRVDNLLDREYQEAYAFATAPVSAYLGVRIELL